ncbi:hypothetical protein WJ63_15165 [Burkholderia pyrrocinia]|nr:hypothetical protein WJ63_15165 [Burkholderia pyrrocinia]
MTIITIIGTDGAGKSALSKSLAGRLDALGVSVTCLDKWDIFDRARHPECRFIEGGRPLMRKCIAEMDSKSRAMFIFWSIGVSMGKHDFSDPREVVLLDGYWMKHAAVEALAGLDEAWIAATAALLRPSDVTLFLDVDPAVAYDRKAATGDFVPYEFGFAPDMTKDSFIRHQSAVRAQLSKWTRQNGWSIIDANRPAATVLADAEAALARQLPVARLVERV